MRRALLVAGLGILATGLWTNTASAQWRRGFGWQDFVPNFRIGPGGLQTQDRNYWDNNYRGDYRYNQWRSGEPRFYRNDQTFYPPPNSNIRYYYGSDYDTGNQQQAYAPVSQDSARVRIFVPDPEAAVWISGRKSQMMGPERVFQSPPLEPGKNYVYKVRVAWHDGDQFRTEEREVNVEANKTATVAFGDAQNRQEGNREEMEAEYQNNANQNQGLRQERMQNNQNRDSLNPAAKPPAEQTKDAIEPHTGDNLGVDAENDADLSRPSANDAPKVNPPSDSDAQDRSSESTTP
jgi:uncharacterized protein (TIGR03000 family)